MGTWGIWLYTAITLAAWTAPLYAEILQGTATKVIDGDTFALDNGDRVRLLDINTPELAHDGAPMQPGSQEAKAFLQKLIEGRMVRLETGKKERDTYHRLLAQVYLPDGTWVNGLLVKAGMAHVYTFADNATLPDQLLPLEGTARSQKLGLWAQPRWQIRDAATCCTESDIGLFYVGTRQSKAYRYSG